jgi:hypothetical protein
MTTRILAGGVPEPEELFGRDHTINYIWEQLRGNNVLLVAPMNHLLKRPRSGYVAVYLDAEDVHDPEVFCSNLIAALLEHSKLRTVISGAKSLPKKVADFISNRVGGIKTSGFEIGLREAVGQDWGSITKAPILEMEKGEETVLFIIDEFPQLVENISRKHDDDAARAFLQWFRLGGSTSVDLTYTALTCPIS